MGNDREVDSADGAEIVSGPGAARGFLTARDAADVLRINERTVRRAIARGELRASKYAGTYRISLEAIEHYRHRLTASTRLPPLEIPDKSPIAFEPRIESRFVSLPVPLTSLIGRDETVADVSSLLREGTHRLVTLTGPGGVGKTRTAVAVGLAVDQDFSDGVVFVDLSAVRDPGLIAAEIAAAFGMQEHRSGTIVDQLIAELRDKRLLLILDNVEQVVDGAPVFVTLLSRCPGISILATSRVRLRLSGEREVVIAPLGLPNEDGPLDQTTVCSSAAIRLFVQRAQAVDSCFVLTSENLADTIAICRRLDGLPLALELAAAWIKVLTPAALRTHLDRGLSLLSGGVSDLPVRQQTIWNTIAWSYDLLPPPEQSLLRRLSVFAGGFTLEAVQAITQDEGSDGQPAPGSSAILHGIAALIDKNLIRREATSSGEPRYSLLETIRAFADKQLSARGEAGDLRNRHADYFLTFADRNQVRPLVHFPAEQPERLATEHANLHAALTWLAESGDHHRLARLVASLGLFWWVHGHVREGLFWLECASALPVELPREAAASIATARGFIALHGADFQLAEGALVQAQALLQAEHRPLSTVFVVSGLASVQSSLGAYQQATALCEEALTLTETVPPADRAAARGAALMNLNITLRGQGDLARAAALSEEVLHLFQSAGYSYGELYVLTDLGNVYRDLGDAPRALDFYRQSLRLAVAYRQQLAIYSVIEGVALICSDLGEMERATRLLVAADQLRERSGVLQRTPDERVTSDRLMADARSALGELAFCDACTAGRAMTVTAAVADVLSICTSDRHRLIPSTPSIRLTARERDILPLLAAGRTNQEIADALCIGLRTVEGHVSRLLTKLGVTTRAAAANVAATAGLLEHETPLPISDGQ